MEASYRVKAEGKENNLLDLIKADDAFPMSDEEIDAIMDPARFTGRAADQVEEFLQEQVDPLLERYQDSLGQEGDVSL